MSSSHNPSLPPKIKLYIKYKRVRDSVVSQKGFGSLGQDPEDLELTYFSQILVYSIRPLICLH